jgi:DNA (cytosine-5)-methyltransferase 1
MRYLSLFSGIGGLDRAVEAHFDAAPAAFVERDPYCQQVLAKRWPGVPIFDDVRQVGAGDVEPVDIVCGGFPCQDLSAAGSQSGLVDGDRSALFFEMARVVAELAPRYVVIENVPALLKWRGTVERALDGYGLTWVKVSAAHVGAPHLRRRVFVLAERGAAHRGVVEAGKVPAAARWPTATRNDYKNAGYQRANGKDFRTLPGATGSAPQRGGVQPAAHWQTPRAKQTMGPSEYDRNSPSLHCEVQPAALWPSVSGMGGGQTSRGGDRKDERLIGGAVQPAARWASPAARDYRSGTGFDRARHYPGRIGSDQLPEQRGGRLAPSWVELLMGFPLGWTDLDCDNPIAMPFPAPMVKGMWGDSPQHEHEPPRTVTGKQAHRTARLRALGNAVVSAQALQALALAVQGPRQAMLFGGAEAWA